MQVVFLGDLHFGARKDSVTYQDYFSKFYNDIFLPYIKKHKIKKVIQFGDFFDNRKSTNTRTLRTLKDLLIDPLAQLGVEMYIICGNHDLYFKNIMQPNSLREHLGHYNHIHIIDKAQTIKLGNLKIDLIPWICFENEEEIIQFINKSKSTIACGHFELSGFNMYRGIENHHGQKTHFLTRYDAVYSGHYHTKSTGENVTYLGTPYELTWADCGDDRGFYSFDTVKKNISFKQNPYKIHHKIMYSDANELLDIKDFNYDYYKDSFIRVIVEQRNDIPHFETFIEALWNNSTPLDISITDIALAYRDIDIESIETQDPLTALITTIDNDTLNTKSLDIDIIKKIAIEIYDEALLDIHEQ